jgi:hypothetical protein
MNFWTFSMSKTFAQAPKPKPLAAEVISAFERGGAGQDTQTHISPKPERPEAPKTEAKTGKEEPTRRLSIDLAESLHRRFKTACTKRDKRMIVEVTKFIERRTAELEKE